MLNKELLDSVDFMSGESREVEPAKVEAGAVCIRVNMRRPGNTCKDAFFRMSSPDSEDPGRMTMLLRSFITRAGIFVRF